MIDKDSIFGLFNEDDSENTSNIEQLVTADSDFLKSPTAKLGMFTKMIYNHGVFHKKLKKFFEKEKTPFNSGQTEEASSFAVFNRAYSYILELNMEKEEHVDALWEFNPKPLLSALTKAIYYFESTEQDEKCAKLYEIKEMKITLEKDVPL